MPSVEDELERGLRSSCLENLDIIFCGKGKMSVRAMKFGIRVSRNHIEGLLTDQMGHWDEAKCVGIDDHDPNDGQRSK